MATLRFSTPSTTMPDLVRRLLPIATPDLFDLQDCDDSGAQEHIVDCDDQGCATIGAEREVA